MALSPVLLFLFSLVGCGRSQNDITNPGVARPPPQGCGADVDPLYRALCDLEPTLRPGTSSPPSGLALALFSLSLAFLVGRTEALCVVRRALWGPLFALCFSCLLAQAVRLKRLVSGKSSPKGSALAGLGVALALVQGIISGEWLLLGVVRERHGACDYPPLDFALVCSYALGLLIAALGLSLGVVLSCEAGGAGGGGGCGPVEGEGAGSKGRRLAWDEAPVLAVALVVQGWVLLLFHAVPEAHLCLRDPPTPSQHDYFDTSQPPPPCFQQDLPLTHGPYNETQTYSIEEHSAALRVGSFHNGGMRPGVPFRGHMYQPTEMALVMNGGTMPTAPVNYTGRQLW
ncbi:hypothetical protein UPYG_G00059610 [Umbra pygmaea]|uniref:G-protein coupled receptors family 3 profile domain-containing protein n=1 Tax=Umbra pygmaea TaxID=75934 RepID=A0ABD0X912_UMBPY